MRQSWLVNGLTVAAGCVAAVVAGYAASRPSVGIAAIALLVVGYLLSRLDGWQRLFVATLVLLLCSVSHVASVAQISFYPRYLALGALVAWTFIARGDAPTAWRRLPAGTRLLLGGLWGCVALAVVSSAWSITPVLTLAQSGALALLAGLVHGLTTRRWTDQRRIGSDLGVAYAVLTIALVAGLGYGFAGGANAWNYADRFQGFLANPNMLSILCALTIPIAWTVYLRSRKLLHLLGVVPAVITLPMTSSRTALLAVVAGACWVIARHGLPTVVRVCCYLGVTGVALQLVGATHSIVGSHWAERLSARFTDAEGGDLSNGRRVTWEASMALWEARPTLGYGYSSGVALFEHTRQAGFLDISVNRVHNSYFQWLLELGLAGAAVLLPVVAGCLWILVRAPLTGVNPGLIWLIATGMLIQITESAMFGTGQPYPYLFWPAVAGVLAASQGPARAGTHRARQHRHETRWHVGSDRHRPGPDPDRERRFSSTGARSR
ncbi:O-antigen ligase family protein [Micromonospora sp. NPDC051296]|uniref:O-antigen ligase family protein n=1 Tax=Micromonospora sp. NPDC051296 TaxID=3155046 RepID=UPI00343B608F